MEAVPSDNVAVFEVASLIATDVGLNTGAPPPGKLVALKLTVPRNPASGVTVTVYCALPVGTTVRDDGLTLTTKSGVAEAGAAATNVL